MSIWGHLRVALFVSGALFASGCIVLISPYEVGDHCTIAGTTTCATCIRTNCQAPIDTCCGTKECGLAPQPGLAGKSDVLGVLDACGGGDRNACITKLSTPRLGTEEEAVRACVTASCNAECIEGGTITNIGSSGERPTWTCGLPRTSTKACATCIFDKCATPLDDCCADSSCSRDTSMQKDMGSCVAGDQAGCAYLYKQSTSGVAGILRGCIDDKCATSCIGNEFPHTSCTSFSSGAYCSCSYAETSTGESCTAAKYGTCVRSVDGCKCGTYSCESTSSSSGCSCDFNGEGGSTDCFPQSSSSSGSSSESVCCLKLDGSSVTCKCEKYTSKCYNEFGEYDIESCEKDVVMASLRSAKRIVAECSN